MEVLSGACEPLCFTEYRAHRVHNSGNPDREFHCSPHSQSHNHLTICKPSDPAYVFAIYIVSISHTYEWISDSYCAINEMHVHAKSHCTGTLTGMDALPLFTDGDCVLELFFSSALVTLAPQWHSLPCSTPLLLSPSSPSFFPFYRQRVFLLLTDFFLWFKVINWEVRQRKIGEIRVVGWLVSSLSSSLCALSLTGSGGKLVLAILIWNGKTNRKVINRSLTS